MDKIVFLDFDGIFSSQMLYTVNGKEAKTFSWGIRYAIDMLKFYSFEVNIITGDSTGSGLDISKKFTENLKIDNFISCSGSKKYEYLKSRYELSNIYYSGDDLFDIELLSKSVGIVPNNAHNALKEVATYISTNNCSDYYFFDLAATIISDYYLIDKAEVLKNYTRNISNSSIIDILNDKSIYSIFVYQQYSMRDHKTNEYDLLLDGNFNLTLHRIYDACQNGTTVYITCPEIVKNLDLFNEINAKIFNNKIELIPCEYGINAMNNMELFSDNLNRLFDVNELGLLDFKNLKILSYFPDSTSNYDITYLFNISKTHTQERAYIDKFFKSQFEAVKKNLAFILNKDQKEYFEDYGEYYGLTNIKEDKNYFNIEYINRLCSLLTTNIDIDYLSFTKYDKLYFFPFRLSDKAYKFEEFLSTLDDSDLVIVTDPNNSLSEFEYTCKIVKIQSDKDATLKHILYDIINSNIEFTIPIYEDFNIVAHQTLLELFHFCPNKVDLRYLNGSKFYEINRIKEEYFKQN